MELIRFRRMRRTIFSRSAKGSLGQHGTGNSASNWRRPPKREENVTEEHTSFKVGIDFESILGAISKQIYETPLAFIRENVQNAVDAIRIQALRENTDPGEDRYRIDITIEDKKIVVRDNGTGMSAGDLQNFFWTIGASGKRTPEALAAGCVGMFGIGGFANFGVCESLEVISQTKDAAHGTLTRLSEA